MSEKDENYFPSTPPPHEDMGPEPQSAAIEYQVYMHRKQQDLNQINQDIGCLRRLLEDLSIRKQRLLKELGEL